MISEFSLNGRIERFESVVCVRHNSVRKALTGEQDVQMCLEAVVCAPGPPVCEE